jgi:hypothetical protein
MKLIAGVVFILVGCALLVSSIVTGSRKLSFLRKAAIAEGTVVRLNAGGSHPEIEFTTASGRQILYPQGGLIFGYRPGDHVLVRYDQQNPVDTACLDVFGALWFTPLLLSAIGVLCLIGGLLSIVNRGTA